jgi:hypothetical protein
VRISGTPQGPYEAETQLKLALMRAIDADLKKNFRTIGEAAEYLEVEYMRLCRIGTGRHEMYSINWLFRLAEAAQVHIRISVDPVNR